MTVLELIESTTPYFARHQVQSPRLTIELMLAEIMQKTRMQLYLDFDKPVPESALERLRPLVKRRAGGEPLEYLLGVTTFAGHRIEVGPDVLIPRPETEIRFPWPKNFLNSKSWRSILAVRRSSWLGATVPNQVRSGSWKAIYWKRNPFRSVSR